MTDVIHARDDSAPGLPLPDEAATLALGATLAAVLVPGLVIWLTGDLGAGKTTLTRGLLRALGHNGPVKSPTYTLMESYVVSRMTLHHFDFYRFTDAGEFLDAGLDEYFRAEAVCLVEWADKARPYVPPADLEIRLGVAGSGRIAHLHASGEQGRACLIALQKSLPSP